MDPVKSYENFWRWFQQEDRLHFKNDEVFEKMLFNELVEKLGEIKEGLSFHINMRDDDNSTELVVSANGEVKSIVFAEELVNCAPKIPGWKFTAMEPETEPDNIYCVSGRYLFDQETLFFYSTEDTKYPDKIDITIVHRYKEKDGQSLAHSVHTFLDHYLGELNRLTRFDHIVVRGKDRAEKELVPITKLRHFLIWREKEFLEKYEGTWYNTKNDDYIILNSKLENGKPLVAYVNEALLEWDCKASHPWIMTVNIRYDGDEPLGLPDELTAALIDNFEDEIQNKLKDHEGSLFIGNETADGLSVIYFACKDFREPSKVLHNLINRNAGSIKASYDIYKDKYWKLFDKFRFTI